MHVTPVHFFRSDDLGIFLLMQKIHFMVHTFIGRDRIHIILMGRSIVARDNPIVDLFLQNGTKPKMSEDICLQTVATDTRCTGYT